MVAKVNNASGASAAFRLPSLQRCSSALAEQIIGWPRTPGSGVLVWPDSGL